MPPGAGAWRCGQLATLEHDREHLVIAQAENVLHACAAVAVLAFDRARIRDLATAGRVEWGLGELHERPLTVDTHCGDGRLLLLGLISRETRRNATLGCKQGCCGATRNPWLKLSTEAQLAVKVDLGTPSTTSVTLLIHQFLESTFIHTQSLFRQQLSGEVKREAECVMQPEGICSGN
jgi:hypothetical protein